MRWRVYYIDGTTFCHLDGEAPDAPGGGVAAIAQEDDTVGVQIHHGNDFYCFDEQFGGWAGLDHFGFAQYLVRPGVKIVKLGEVMTTNAYTKLVKSIRKDPDLPSKSACYPWEVIP